jgi:hypothetical protein
MRASVVVNRQRTGPLRAVRVANQAVTFRVSVAGVARRAPRHCQASTASSSSATLSRLPWASV